KIFILSFLDNLVIRKPPKSVSEFRGSLHILLRLVFLFLFGAIESMFLISSLAKFLHGGYVTVIIAAFIGAIMYIWYFGNKVRDRREAKNAYVRLDEYISMLSNLSHDDSVPLYSTNL